MTYDSHLASQTIDQAIDMAALSTGSMANLHKLHPG
jgi:hypothetical protein